MNCSQIKLKKTRLPRVLVDREKFCLKECVGKSVLHVGFCDSPYMRQRLKNGNWFHQKLSLVCKDLLGLDIVEEDIMLAISMGYKAVYVTSFEWKDYIGEKYFDIVLLGEVIEHIDNTRYLLKAAKSVLNTNGRILITTPNPYSARRFLKAGFGFESIHPEHVGFHSISTLSNLAAQNKLTVEACFFYRLPDLSPFFSIFIDKIFSLIHPALSEGIITILK